jgi:hypothetical protein
MIVCDSSSVYLNSYRDAIKRSARNTQALRVTLSTCIIGFREAISETSWPPNVRKTDYATMPWPRSKILEARRYF